MAKPPRTDSGFAVELPESRRLITIYPASDIKFRHPFKVKRTLAPAFQCLIDHLDALEPVNQVGWDGGYSYRPKNLAVGTAEPDDWSEHAAGAAIDWNASQHPQRAARFVGWNAHQVALINRFLESKLGQVFEWGADWRHPDPMHFQVKDARRWADTWVHFQWPAPRIRPATPAK